jgi:hypothetical protein
MTLFLALAVLWVFVFVVGYYLLVSRRPSKGRGKV